MSIQFILVTLSPIAGRLIRASLEKAETAHSVVTVNDPFESRRYALSGADEKNNVIIFDLELDRSEVLRTVNVIEKERDGASLDIFVVITPESFRSTRDTFRGIAKCIIVDDSGLSRITTIASYCQALLNRQL